MRRSETLSPWEALSTVLPVSTISAGAIRWNPRRPRTVGIKLAQLVRANRALYDYTTAYGVPCISGKDSMKNDYIIGETKISIPPTLLFSTMGKIEDVRKAVTMDAKKAGDLVYLLGETHEDAGRLRVVRHARVCRQHRPESRRPKGKETLPRH